MAAVVDEAGDLVEVAVVPALGCGSLDSGPQHRTIGSPRLAGAWHSVPDVVGEGSDLLVRVELARGGAKHRSIGRGMPSGRRSSSSLILPSMTSDLVSMSNNRRSR